MQHPIFDTPSHCKNATVGTHLNVVGQWELCSLDALLVGFFHSTALVAIPVHLTSTDPRSASYTNKEWLMTTEERLAKSNQKMAMTTGFNWPCAFCTGESQVLYFESP